MSSFLNQLFSDLIVAPNVHLSFALSFGHYLMDFVARPTESPRSLSTGFDLKFFPPCFQGGVYDWCPLGLALSSGDEGLSKFLVDDQEADPNVARSAGAETLLSVAVSERDFKTVKFLLTELKADVNKACSGCINPFQMALLSDFQR